MSKYSLETLNSGNILRGFTSKRGNAWWYREALANGNTTQFPGAVPFAEAERVLSFPVHESPVMGTMPCDVTDPHMVGIDNNGIPFKYLTDPTRKMIVRSDKPVVMGITGKGYTLHRYAEWLLNNVSTILGNTLDIGSVGVLDNGRQAWVQIEAPETLEVNGMGYRPHLLAVTSYDMTLATEYRTAVTVVQCDNTLSAALSERTDRRYRVKHTRNSLLRLKDARDALRVVESVADDFEAQVQHLCSITVTDAEWRRFLDAYVPLPEDKGRGLTIAENKRMQLQNLYTRDAACAPWNGTAMGVVQAVNTWTHHLSTVKGTTRTYRNQSAAMRGEWDKVDNATYKTLVSVLSR